MVFSRGFDESQDLAVLKSEDFSHWGEKLSRNISMMELSLWQKLLQCLYYSVFYCIGKFILRN